VVVVWGAIQGNQLPGSSPPVTSPFYSARQHGLTFQFNHRDFIVIATDSDNAQVPCILNTRISGATPIGEKGNYCFIAVRTNIFYGNHCYLSCSKLYILLLLILSFKF
jgi:hypothetical protein